MFCQTVDIHFDTSLAVCCKEKQISIKNLSEIDPQKNQDRISIGFLAAGVVLDRFVSNLRAPNWFQNSISTILVVRGEQVLKI